MMERVDAFYPHGAMTGCRACNREVPLITIGVSEPAAAEPLSALMRSEGAIVLIVEGDRASLRATTPLSPRVVLVDSRRDRGCGLVSSQPSQWFSLTNGAGSPLELCRCADHGW
jgi:hypothetical protein